MVNEKEIAKIKEEIQTFREMFKDNPVEQIKNGTWFTKVLQLVLTEHATKTSPEFFRVKYPGLDKEKIAYRLVGTTSNYAAIAGGIAAATVTLSELTTLVSGGAALTVAAGAIIGEIAYITYIQLKLVYDISLVLDARLERDDPEDMLTIFWYTLGVNFWEDVSNALVKEGARSAEYVAHKVLRNRVRDAMGKVASKLGGTRLAGKITEKTILKLVIPGISIIIASGMNKGFTHLLGKNAIMRLKHRGVAIRLIDDLQEYERYYQLLAIPMIYQVAIKDEPKTRTSKSLEMQSNITKRLAVQEEEYQLIDELIDIEFLKFCELLKDVKDKKVSEILYEIAVYSYLLSNSSDVLKIRTIAFSLGIDFSKENLEQARKKI